MTGLQHPITDSPTTVGVVSSFPDQFTDDGGLGGIACPTASDCWVAGRYPPIGGASNQWDAAVVRVVNGAPQTPQVIPDSPYTATNHIACGSSDTCLIATTAFDASHNAGPGFAMLRNGMVGAPVFIDTGLYRGVATSVDCAGPVCVVIGFGNITNDFRDLRSAYFAVVVRDGVAGPVVVFPETTFLPRLRAQRCSNASSAVRTPATASSLASLGEI